MNEPLTARQTQILKSLVDEYIETAEPVGSMSLEKKYSLGISPATIRNEMAALTDKGYLNQPHTSAGRIPTPIALKFYVSQLMEEKQMSLADEVKAKEQVWDARNDLDQLMEEATAALAQRTGSLAVGVISEGDKIWHSGYANLFKNPEFYDVEVCANVFGLLEEIKRMRELFFERTDTESAVEILFGEELGWQGFRPIGIAATHVQVQGRDIGLGIIGPARLRYPTVIPVLRYFSNLLEEITR